MKLPTAIALIGTLLGLAELSAAAPMTTQPIQTLFGDVSVTYDPDDPTSVTANVAGMKDEQGNVTGGTVTMNSVNLAASAHGTAIAYCAPASSFTYCDANGNDLMHYGPWYFFRSMTPSAQSGNWITDYTPPVPFGPPGPPRPDGPNGPGAGQFTSSDQITIGMGDRGFIDSPGINLPCPPQPGANTEDQTLTQKFTTVLYTGHPPMAWCMFKWGHTITYNEASKATSIEPCPVTSHLAGQQTFTDCLNALNAHASAAGYDDIDPVQGYRYVYLGPSELELPPSVLSFVVQVDLDHPSQTRRQVIRQAVALIKALLRDNAQRR